MSLNDGKPQDGTPDGGNTPDGTPSEKTVVVVVDGKEVPVTEKELVNGYLRQADYTRKTTALKTERESLALREVEFESAVKTGVEKQLESLIRLESAAGGAEAGAGAANLRDALLGGGNEGSDDDDGQKVNPAVRKLMEGQTKELSELKNWKDQQERESAMRRYDTEVSSAKKEHEIFADPTIKVNPDFLIDSLVLAKRMSVRDAVKEVAETLKATKDAAVEQYLAEKTGQRVPRPGGGGGKVPSTPARQIDRNSLDNGDLLKMARDRMAPSRS